MDNYSKKIHIIGNVGSGKTLFLERGLASINQTKGYTVTYPGRNIFESRRRNQEYYADLPYGTARDCIVEASIKKGLFGNKKVFRITDTNSSNLYSKALLIEEARDEDVLVACIDSTDDFPTGSETILDVLRDAVAAGINVCVLLTKCDEVSSEELDVAVVHIKKMLGDKIRIKPVNSFQELDAMDNPGRVLRDILGV